MNAQRITQQEALDKALGAERFLLFKHSTICPVSSKAFDEYSAFLAEHVNLPSGWIEVREQRDWSHLVARRLGIEHESPQALWIRDGAVAWHASHFDITREALELAVAG